MGNKHPTYEQLIVEGIKGLPSDVLAEIAHFVLFMRKRVAQPQLFETELQTALLQENIDRLRQAELNHLEDEFKDYEFDFPHE